MPEAGVDDDASLSSSNTPDSHHSSFRPDYQVDQGSRNVLPHYGSPLVPTAARNGSNMLEYGHRAITQPASTHEETHHSSSASRSSTASVSVSQVRDRMIGSFFIHFWPAHPILVPRRFYAAQEYPEHLEVAVCDIGNHFLSASSCLKISLEAILAPRECTVYAVQTLLLYAILLHSRHQPVEADRCVSQAAAFAEALGMHEPSFAQYDRPIATESYRRTWWELYSIDTYLAGLHQRPRHLRHGVGSDALPLLPCSHHQYESGDCERRPSSIQAFDERMFTDVPVNFSSYCYRIEAIRIIDRILTMSATPDVKADDVQAIDNALASWKFNLPSIQSDVIDSSGNLDQMLFQAHYYIACANIFLHFPRSDLPPTVPSISQLTCGKGYPQLSPTSAQHTIKAAAASKELSNLAAVPWPMDRHSPLFTCALVLGCIVQLAAASFSGSECIQHHRDRVVLMMGALRHLGHKWQVAANAAVKLKPVANMIFTARRELAEASSTEPLVDSGIGTIEDFIDVPWFSLFEPELGQCIMLQG